jgi:hypothetical protein
MGCVGISTHFGTAGHFSMQKVLGQHHSYVQHMSVNAVSRITGFEIWKTNML